MSGPFLSSVYTVLLSGRATGHLLPPPPPPTQLHNLICNKSFTALIKLPEKFTAKWNYANFPCVAPKLWDTVKNIVSCCLLAALGEICIIFSLCVSSPPQSTQNGNVLYLVYIPSWWKNLPRLVRVGCTPTPCHFIYHQVQSCGVPYAPAERADTLPLFLLYPYVYSVSLPHEKSTVKELTENPGWVSLSLSLW